MPYWEITITEKSCSFRSCISSFQCRVLRVFPAKTIRGFPLPFPILRLQPCSSSMAARQPRQLLSMPVTTQTSESLRICSAANRIRNISGFGSPEGRFSQPRHSLPAPVPSISVSWAAATSLSMASRSGRATSPQILEISTLIIEYTAFPENDVFFICYRKSHGKASGFPWLR